jgi:hypothetical protein
LNVSHLTRLRRFAGNRLPLANRSAMGTCMNQLRALPHNSTESGGTGPLRSTRRCSPNKWPGPTTTPSARLQGVVRDSNPRNVTASTAEPSRAPRLRTGPSLLGG